MLHMNTRSIKNKLDVIKESLNSLSHKISVIGVTETWLNNENKELCNIDGYDFISKQRKAKDGGDVGVYVTEYLQYKVREDLSYYIEDIYESIFIELQQEEKHIIIGVIYRPPNNNNKEFEEYLDKTLTRITQENKSTYIMGDFNIDLLKIDKNKFTDNFINQLLSSAFYPLISKPTRMTNKTATLIDNIFTNRINEDRISGILFSDISDHLPIFTIYKNSNIKTHKKLYYKEK